MACSRWAFAGEALACYGAALQLNESKMAQEPGRADYRVDPAPGLRKVTFLKQAKFRPDQ